MLARDPRDREQDRFAAFDAVHDIMALADADAFVGTYSSNIGEIECFATH